MNKHTFLYLLVLPLLTMASVASAEVGGTITRTIAITPISAPLDQELLTMNIAPELADCVGVSQQKCMIVNGKYFYDTISGFEHEAGYHYILRVAKSTRTNVPADASAYTYTLVKEIIKRPAQPTGTAELVDALHTAISKLVTIMLEKHTWEYQGHPITFAAGRYSTNLGCNTLMGSYELYGTNIVFSAGASTLMACPSELMATDDKFSTALPDIETIEFKHGNLVLSGSDTDMLLTKQ